MYDRHNQNRLLIPVLACCAVASVLIGTLATVAVQQDSPPVAQTTTKPPPKATPKTPQPTTNYSSPPDKKKPMNAGDLLNPGHYHETLKNYLAKYENDPSSVEIIEFTRVKQWTHHVEAGVTYRAKNSFGVMQTKTIRFMFLDGQITNVPVPGY